MAYKEKKKMTHMLYGLKSNPNLKISSGELEEYYLGAMQQMGFKTARDIFSGAFLNKQHGASMFTTKAAEPTRKAQFYQTGTGIEINSTTVAVTDLLREIGTVMEIKSFYSHYVKDTLSEAVQVIVETIAPIQGAQQDRKIGQPFNEVIKVGNQSASFTPAYSGEKIVVDEQDILALREIGVNNFSIRGIAQYLAIWTEQLAIRAYTKKQILLQEAIFQGQFTWYGQTFSFGVPSGNTLVPITGQPWATLQSGVLQMNPAALPLTDVRYFISNNASIRRLKPFLKGLVMNRNTHSWFYTNPEVQQLIQYGYMANPAIIAKEPRGATMEGMIEYFLGGDMKVAIYVDDSTYQADASDPLGNAANSINYFIPDGQVLFVFDLMSYGGDTVDFVYTPAVQNGGSFLDARPGLFMVMEDLTQPGTFGGYENPSIKLLCGFNGMPRVKRPNDLFILNTLG
jgi:hypothetical protein